MNNNYQYICCNTLIYNTFQQPVIQVNEGGREKLSYVKFLEVPLLYFSLVPWALQKKPQRNRNSEKIGLITYNVTHRFTTILL